MNRLEILRNALIKLFAEETICGDENDSTSTKSIFLYTASKYFRELEKQSGQKGEIKFNYGAKSFSGSVCYENEYIQVRIFQSGTPLSVFYEITEEDIHSSLTMSNIGYLEGLFKNLPKEENEFMNVSKICS